MIIYLYETEPTTQNFGIRKGFLRTLTNILLYHLSSHFLLSVFKSVPSTAI